MPKTFNLLKLIVKHYAYKLLPKGYNLNKTIKYNNSSIKILKDEALNFLEAVKLAEEKFGKDERAKEVTTIFSFINLSMIDIITLFNLYLKSNSHEEKHLICRTAALHMYEFLEDGGKIFGTDLKLFSEIHKSKDLDPEIKEIRKIFFKIKKENIELLKAIRNNVSGHKDRDIDTQIEVNNRIDVEKFHLFFFQFLYILFPYSKLKKKLKKVHPV